MRSAKVSSLSRVTPKSRTLDEKVKSGKVEAVSLWSNLRSAAGCQTKSAESWRGKDLTYLSSSKNGDPVMPFGQ